MPDDFTLALLTPSLKAGVEADFAFRVLDRAGQAVTRYEIRHEKPLHLILVSRDLNLFRQVHPALGSDGTWRLTLDALPVGPYREYADCQPVDGPVLALGADFAVARPLPPPSRTKIVDGYKVALARHAGRGRDDDAHYDRAAERPTGDRPRALSRCPRSPGHDRGLRPVLPTRARHGHAGGTGPGDVPHRLPGGRRYRLFFQFQHGGVVRTAPITVKVAGSAGWGGGHGGHD